MNSGLPVTLAAVKMLARVDHGDDDLTLDAMIRTAAREIEAHSSLAFLTTTVTATVEAGPCDVIELPVGPMLSGATVTLALIAADGTTSAVSSSAYWVEAGRYPRVNLTDTAPAGVLRIVYPAGFGDTSASVPADLAHAVADHAAMLFDMRGAGESRHAHQGLSLAAARIAARHRRIRA